MQFCLFDNNNNKQNNCTFHAVCFTAAFFSETYLFYTLCCVQVTDHWILPKVRKWCETFVIFMIIVFLVIFQYVYHNCDFACDIAVKYCSMWWWTWTNITKWTLLVHDWHTTVASVPTQRRHHGALEILIVLYCILLWRLTIAKPLLHRHSQLLTISVMASKRSIHIWLLKPFGWNVSPRQKVVAFHRWWKLTYQTTEYESAVHTCIQRLN